MDGTPDSRRWWALAALVPVALALNIDATVLGLALPRLADAFHATTAQLQWFVAAYTLVFAAGMIPGGMLGDRFGRKRLLLAALVVFAVGSVLCAYAPSAGAFIAARCLLGLGAAVATPLTLGVLPVLFDETERGKAVAVVMTATMLGYPIGPILGGWLLSSFWWGWVFLINLPVVALAIGAVALLLPESRSSEARALDGAGVLVSSAGLALLSYGVIEAGQIGWTDTASVVEMIGGALVLAGFVTWERRVSEPLVDLALFRVRGFSGGTALGVAVTFALFGLMFALPLYFQEVLATSAMGAGIRMLPMIGGLLVGAAAGVRVAGRLGARAACSLGFLVLAVGLAAGARTEATTGYEVVVAWIVVVGLGVGLAMPTAMDAALGALTAERSGVGSATIQALRMVGGSFGAAILGSLLNSAYRARLDVAGLPASTAAAVRESVVAGVGVAQRLDSPELLGSVRGAFVHGMDVMLLGGAAAGVVGVLLAVWLLPGAAARARARSRGELTG